MSLLSQYLRTDPKLKWSMTSKWSRDLGRSCSFEIREKSPISFISPSTSGVFFNKPKRSTTHMFRTKVLTCAVKLINATTRSSYYSLSTRASCSFPLYADRISNALLCTKLSRNKSMVVMAKRKSHSIIAQERSLTTIPTPATLRNDSLPPVRRFNERKASQAKLEPASTILDRNPNILDEAKAVRATPGAEGVDERLNVENAGIGGDNYSKKEDKDNDESDSPLSDLSNADSPAKAQKFKAKPARRAGIKSRIADDTTDVVPAVPAATIKQQPAQGPRFLDPEAESDEEADEEEIQAALSRPPPVNSDYLPLPWKGRLGYVRRDISTASFADIRPGLPMYVSTLFKSAGLQLSDLPHRIHPRKPTPTQRSQ